MPRKQYEYHYIYKTTNILNNKFYIGMHSTNDLNDGYVGSGRRLWRSINKHGKENHITEILEYLPDRESLRYREKEIVNKELINEYLCINLTIGGQGINGSFQNINQNSELQRQKAKKSAIKQKWLRENDPEWVRRKSEKISIGGKLAYIEGRNIPHAPDCTGMKHSEETKRKIGKASTINQKGENNSQYGTRWAWINKNGIIKRVKYGEHIILIKKGWQRGIKEKMPIMNICSNCNNEFEAKQKNIKFCSTKCRQNAIPLKSNKVRDNFQKLYEAYIKYGTLCKAFKECNIIRSSNGYNTFYELLKQRN